MLCELQASQMQRLIRLSVNSKRARFYKTWAAELSWAIYLVLGAKR